MNEETVKMRNNPKLFIDLDLSTLIQYATDWAENYPLIRRISLYKGSIESESKYIFVVRCKKQTSGFKEYKAELAKIKSKYPIKIVKENNHIREKFIVEKKALKEEYSDKYPGLFYYNWASEDCLHIAKEIQNFYIDKPKSDCRKDWMWISAYIRGSLPRGIVEKRKRWILFNEGLTLKRQVSEDFLKKARLEIDKIYNELKRKGLTNPKSIKSTSKSRLEAALSYYEQNRKCFKIIKKNHLNDINCYNTVEKIKRKIVGCILRKIILSEGYEPIGGQELYNISCKLL